MYTVKGYDLSECPTFLLEAEKEAAIDMKKMGCVDKNNWAKLSAVEDELKKRNH